MTTTTEILLDKAEVIAALSGLPDKVSAEDIIDKVLFMKRLEIGLREAEAGNGTPHEEVMAKFKEWKKERLAGYLLQDLK